MALSLPRFLQPKSATRPCALRARALSRFTRLPLGLLLGMPVLTPAVQAGPAQSQAAPERPAQSGPALTLHAYTSLIQIPVLVLDSGLRPLPHLSPARFGISLNGGPVVAPSDARLQGDEPIALAILVDAHAVDRDYLLLLAEALAAASLHRQDRVVLFALGCNFTRTPVALPANEAHLKSAFRNALHATGGLEHSAELKTCAAATALWDAAAFATSEVALLPGRPVVFAVSDGDDHGSTIDWAQLRQYANTRGVALFALAPPELRSDAQAARSGILTRLCELTGGLVIPADLSQLPGAVSYLLRILRARYILSFPRPRNLQAQAVDLAVTVSQAKAFIRPAGIAVPVEDPSLAGDPFTVPSASSGAPTLGSHRLITPR